MTSTETIPGYLVGTWNIDPVHSDISFTVRHLMVSKVRGRFGSYEGQIVTAENPLESKVKVSVDLSSIDTGDAGRDEHLKGDDIFNVATHSKMTFESTSVSSDGDDYLVEGDLTIHDITKRVNLKVEANGFGPDPWGGTRAGFSAKGEISRKDFGITFNIPLDGGGVAISDKVQIIMEIEGVLQPAAA